MDTNLQTACFNCSKPLPPIGYFCGGCLTQVKCKSCGSILEKDYIGCINCGTPKEVRAETRTTSPQNINTFRLHETPTDRTIEATFSDDVAKDLAGTLRDAAAAGSMKAIASNIPPDSDFNKSKEETTEFTEAEVLNNENIDTKAEATNKQPSDEISKSTEYPALRAVAMKNLPANETEWIVVYAFYASEYGKEIFSRDNIINQYVESNRFSKKTTKRDLSTSIKRAVVGGYINPLQTGYSILEEGITKAKEIIIRTSSSSPRISKANKTNAKKIDADTGEDNADIKEKANKKKTTSVKSYKLITDINFHPAGQKSLNDFVKDYNIKNDSERNLLFTYYLSENLKIEKISLDHLYTCYEEVNHKIPENMQKSFGNARTKGWLKTENTSIEITTKGKNKIKFWDKKD